MIHHRICRALSRENGAARSRNGALTVTVMLSVFLLLHAGLVPSGGVYDVTKYGAKGDAKSVDSASIRAAAAA